MMKTPEEIKKGLECCIGGDCDSCPYHKAKLDCGDILKSDTIAYIQQLEKQVPKWISVEDEYPIDNDDVLVLIGGKDVDVGFFYGYVGVWRIYGCVAGVVTHWMPLPEAPKEE